MLHIQAFKLLFAAVFAMPASHNCEFAQQQMQKADLQLRDTPAL